MNELDLIKEAYFNNGGSTFHMSREEPEKYELYQRLKPDEETLKQWDAELLEKKFSELWQDRDFVWGRVSQIIKILNRGRADEDYWASRLLDEMEKMDELDKHSKIIIIETMSGRNTREDKGGVHLICEKTSQEAKMVRVMNKLMDFSCDEDDNINRRGWDNTVNRFLVAVGSYEKAYKRFGKARKA